MGENINEKINMRADIKQLQKLVITGNSHPSLIVSMAEMKIEMKGMHTEMSALNINTRQLLKFQIEERSKQKQAKERIKTIRWKCVFWTSIIAVFSGILIKLLT
jgi:hypothetical protein